MGSLLEVGTGFHPELTGRENIYLNGAILGMKRREIEAKLPEIVEFSGVETFIDTPVKRYSSGMHVRLAFSVAAHFEPEILLVDEVLTVGDAEFQRRSLGRMEEIGATGRTVLFVSHQLQAVTQLCDRAILLDGGRVVRDGPSNEVVANYLQSGAGMGSSQPWPDIEKAPGDDLVRLRSVRIVGPDGGDCRLQRRSPAGRHRARIPCPARRPARRTPRSRSWPEARSPSTRWTSIRAGTRHSAPGEYVATAWIPGNFLNEGLITVDAAVCSIDSPKLNHHVSAFNAVSFHVQDPLEGDSARGTFTGQWRGVVRPLLDWTCAERSLSE